MKLERLHEYILVTVVTVIGVGLAAYAGKYSGAGEIKSLAMIAGVAVFALIGFQMRARVWLLIVLTSGIAGKLPFLPIPLSIQELGVVIAFAWYLVFKAVKIVRTRPVYDLVDIVLVLNLVWIAVAFIRHPVGGDALGSDRVGGRPYFAIVLSMLAYWVLARAEVTPTQARRLPLFVAMGSLFDTLIGSLTFFVPATAPILSKLYSGASMDTFNDTGVLADAIGGETRLTFMGWGGRVGIGALCSYFRPLTCINPIYFWRFLSLVICLILILFSGFRSLLSLSIVVIFVSSYFQRRKLDMWSMAFVGIPVLAVMLLGQGVAFNLPFSVQRTLSFLPGRWDYRAMSNAEDSTEWRTYMWKAMLTEKKYIDNRWLGDGFGYTKAQFQAMMMAGTAGGEQETFLITGQVHSGPLSTIRFVGYIGFAFYLTLLVLIAKKGIRLMRRAYGTPFLPWALFIGVPAVIEPFNFVLVTGGFDNALAGSVMLVGMMKVLERGLEDYLKTESNPLGPGTPDNLPAALFTRSVRSLSRGFSPA